MYLSTIDCGTTNSRVYIVDENGQVLTRASEKVGVRDTAISGSNQVLKDGLQAVFRRALEQASLQETDIACILSSGMITSELGLVEIPHLWAPCSMEELAANLTRVEGLGVFPESIPLYFVRGIKNRFDPKTISIQDVGTLDFMRGEEAQAAGLLAQGDLPLPAIVTILSSHTKFMPIDAERRVLGSVTTLSGQLYEAVLKETFVGKSVRAEDDYDDSETFDGAIVDHAFDEIERSGLLRSLMYVRFLDTLVHTPWYERKLFAESLLAAEDMRALPQVEELTGMTCDDYVLIGLPRRCQIYAHLLRSKINPRCRVKMITAEAEIDQLSIHGAIALAKMKGII